MLFVHERSGRVGTNASGMVALLRRSRLRLSAALATGLIVTLGGSVDAAIISISLTSDALGLGSADINFAGNASAIEDDRPGQLVTSSTANVGSVLSIQTDNLAGPGTPGAPLLATVTARAHLDIQTNLPAGFDIQAGVITLTRDTGILANDGLGVRAFGIDLDPGSPDYAKRFHNAAFVSAGNPNGYQMEGSKEVSGGVNETDFLVWAAGQPFVPGNNPPHVDEDVTFDINDAELNVPADSVRVLLTKIKAGNDNLFDLAIDLTINLVGGGVVFNSYGRVGDAPDVFSQFGTDNIIEVDFSAASLGLSPTDLIDSFIIGARDDTADPIKGTDEHFRIHGFSVIPEPATFALLAAGAGLVVGGRRRRS